jgi:hypothetical protein
VAVAGRRGSAHFANLSKGKRERLDLDKAGGELADIEDVPDDSLKVVTYDAKYLPVS